MISPTVLSIQSHVVHGYVGNKSCTFPLQLHGFEVDAINTVQLSNHVQYEMFTGQILDRKDLEDLLKGLEGNDLLQIYSHILTGYCKTSLLLKTIGELVKKMKGLNPNLKYVCDPVLGDNGNFYVEEESVKILSDELLPLADLITPNQFEAEQLTGIKIKSDKDVKEVLNRLHAKGPAFVVITSTDLNKETLMAFASKKVENKAECFQINFPKINSNFVGSGDLFTSLMLAWLYKTDWNLKDSLEKTVATMQCVLERTSETAINSSKSHSLELKIIQSKKDIECPLVSINASKY